MYLRLFEPEYEILVGLFKCKNTDLDILKFM